MDNAREPGQPDNGRVWLNTAGVVDRIIRDFTAEVIGMVGREDFMAQLEFRYRAMNNLFLGITPNDRYQIGLWNSPDQLGIYVLLALQIEGETRLAVRDRFGSATADRVGRESARSRRSRKAAFGAVH